MCLNCGAVQKIRGTGMDIEVVESWKLEIEEVPEHDHSCTCAVCHLKRKGETDGQ